MNSKDALSLIKSLFLLLLVIVSMFWGFPALQIIASILTNGRYSAIEVFACIVPLIYLISSFLSCTKLLDGKRLFKWGIIVNSMIFVWAASMIYLFNVYFHLCIALILGSFWLALYYSQIDFENEQEFEIN